MNRPLNITVATLTRRRPQMLAKLLDSFADLKIPIGCVVRFLVVENDDASYSRSFVERFGGFLPNGSLDYVLETEPGIPFGRNRAAREAISAGHDLLAFVDDDEVVAKDWLVRLVDGYRRSGAVLVGGPLKVAPAPEGLGWFQRKMHSCLVRRFAHKAARKSARAESKGTAGVNIVTNNWLSETSVFTEHGIWFDERMRFTGGTDTKFSIEVKQAGLPTAWAHDACAYEVIPAERLAFRYQFNRARSQSNNNFRRKVEETPTVRWSAAVSILSKSVTAFVLLLALVPSNGRTILGLAHTGGWIAGRIDVLLGRYSIFYKSTTGH